MKKSKDKTKNLWLEILAHIKSAVIYVEKKNCINQFQAFFFFHQFAENYSNFLLILISDCTKQFRIDSENLLQYTAVFIVKDFVLKVLSDLHQVRGSSPL